jgi:hypothetical protein
MTARLPDLLVIGAPKAATTTLVHWLREHPGVAVGSRKEVEYFDLNHHRGLDWYLEQLPQDPGERLVVEGTPSYMSEPGAAERIAATLPEARFVAVLREPVARAWSNYWFFRMLGVESRSWGRAFAAALDEPSPDDHPGYVWRGRYAEQLARWESLVGRERLHVALFDEVLADPQAVYDGICAFAGLSPRTLPSRESVNPTLIPRFPRLQPLLRSNQAGRVRAALYRWNAQGRPVPAMTPRQAAQAAERFAEPNARLEEWLGRPLPARWHDAPGGVSPAAHAGRVGGSPRS